MSPRNFFRVVLKLFALFFLLGFVAMIPQIISAVSFLFGLWAEDSGGIIAVFIWAIFIIALYGYVTFLLFFRTDKILDLLKLDQGFDQDSFSFEFPKRAILTTGLIVVGGIILVGEVPNFCSTIFKAIQDKSVIHLGFVAPDWPGIIASAVKIIIGLLLLGERRRIVDFIDGKQIQESQPVD